MYRPVRPYVISYDVAAQVSASCVSYALAQFDTGGNVFVGNDVLVNMQSANLTYTQIGALQVRYSSTPPQVEAAACIHTTAGFAVLQHHVM